MREPACEVESISVLKIANGRRHTVNLNCGHHKESRLENRVNLTAHFNIKNVLMQIIEISQTKAALDVTVFSALTLSYLVNTKKKKQLTGCIFFGPEKSDMSFLGV